MEILYILGAIGLLGAGIVIGWLANNWWHARQWRVTAKGTD